MKMTMVNQIIKKFESIHAWEFVNAMKAMAEKLEELEKDNLELKRIKGKKCGTIILVKGNEIIECKNLSQVAKYLDIYTWEAECLLDSGDEYNGYYLDIRS